MLQKYCTKLPYATGQDAALALEKLKQRAYKYRNNRIYRCYKCNQYHIASRHRVRAGKQARIDFKRDRRVKRYLQEMIDEAMG